MKTKRLIIKIDEELCNGCGQCIVNCAESALYLEGGKARLRAEKYCDGLGACLGHCPTGALTLVEEDVDPYDHAAVEALIRQQSEAAARCGCPSSRAMSLGAAPGAGHGSLPGPGTGQDRPGLASSLGNWPLQLHLVPVNALFLKGARLLLTADCVPVALPDYHPRFVSGRAVLLGCPKLDDTQAYVDKLARIMIESQPEDITVLEMEVPCCAGMTRILEAARDQAGSSVPIRTVVVSRRGEILSGGRPGLRPLGL